MVKCADFENVRPVIVFDGICNFCNGWVSFVSKRDDAHIFSFTAAQSDTGRRLLISAGYNFENIETILLVSNSNIYIKSDAVIRILAELGGIWPLISLLRIIPSSFRDFFYDIIAKHRYRIAGRREVCAIPPEDIRERFLS